MSYLDLILRQICLILVQDLIGHLLHNAGQPFDLELPNAVSSSETSLKYVWSSVEGTSLTLAVVLPTNDFKVCIDYTCILVCIDLT